MRLFMITNSPSIAKFAVQNGVERIFIDLEVNGKLDRQGHLDTLMSNHDISDIGSIRNVIGNAELLVRINPMHEGSALEIDKVVAANADIIMLPMFRSVNEVVQLCKLVNARARICLLAETKEALDLLPSCIQVPGVNEVHIGLNDLSIDLKLPFLFEPFVNGTVERAAEILKKAGVPFGIGGVARCGEGLLPAEMILLEHFRLGSSAAILSRTFHRQATSVEQINNDMDFAEEVRKIQAAYAAGYNLEDHILEENRLAVMDKVHQISGRLENKQKS